MKRISVLPLLALFVLDCFHDVDRYRPSSADARRARAEPDLGPASAVDQRRELARDARHDRRPLDGRPRDSRPPDRRPPDRRPPDQGCLAPTVLCHGQCVDPTSSPDHCGGCDRPCLANSTCTQGACACKPGFKDCNKVPGDGCESNLATDKANCGACGVVCPYHCVASACVCSSSVAGSCGTSKSLYCTASGTCATCASGTFNCDTMGSCTCTGVCVGNTCNE